MKLKAPSYAPFQSEIINGSAKMRVVLKSRQIGISTASTARGVKQCAVEPYTQWLWASAGERQAKELIRKGKMHLDLLNAVAVINEVPIFVDKKKIKAEEIEFKNGSRILSVPANPDTIRGFSGNVLLDEFAFHRNAREIWAALAPSASLGHEILIVSTPNGASGMFYELWNRENAFGKQKIDIHEAKKQGFPVDVELLRSMIDDPDVWAQEYECQFLSDAANYIPMGLIEEAVSEEAEKDITLEELDLLAGSGARLFLGMDIGRKRDLSVITIAQEVAGVLIVRYMAELEREEFETQEQMLHDLQPFIKRGCIDSSGLGMQLAENMTKAYPSKFEGVDFTMQNKNHMATQMKVRFEKRRIKIPDCRATRYDIHSVKKYVTAVGNVRFDADRTDKGHADRFWSIALAAQAAEGPEITYNITHVKKRRARAQREYL